MYSCRAIPYSQHWASKCIHLLCCGGRKSICILYFALMLKKTVLCTYGDQFDVPSKKGNSVNWLWTEDQARRATNQSIVNGQFRRAWDPIFGTLSYSCLTTHHLPFAIFWFSPQRKLLQEMWENWLCSYTSRIQVYKYRIPVRWPAESCRVVCSFRCCRLCLFLSLIWVFSVDINSSILYINIFI